MGGLEGLPSFLWHGDDLRGTCYRSLHTHSSPEATRHQATRAKPSAKFFTAFCVAMAAPASVRVWFRLDGDTSADRVVLPAGADVADLRDRIKERLAHKLQHVDVVDLVLSTADNETRYDEAAPVPAVHETKARALVVKGACVRSRARWSPRQLIVLVAVRALAAPGAAGERLCRALRCVLWSARRLGPGWLLCVSALTAPVWYLGACIATPSGRSLGEWR